MILVEKPSKPFQYTAKSTVRRQLVLSEYQTEIDELYRTVEASAQEIVAPPAEWTAESSLVFVRELVGKVLNKTVGDDADVFQHGCDRCAFQFVCVRGFIADFSLTACRRRGSETEQWGHCRRP